MTALIYSTEGLMTKKLTTKQQRKFEAFARKFDKLSIDGKRAVYFNILANTNPKLRVSQAIAKLDTLFPRS
jgi:hypothetical protein